MTFTPTKEKMLGGLLLYDTRVFLENFLSLSLFHFHGNLDELEEVVEDFEIICHGEKVKFNSEILKKISPAFHAMLENPLMTSIEAITGHSWPEIFKKSRPKKLVKSNKPISRIFF